MKPNPTENKGLDISPSDKNESTTVSADQKPVNEDIKRAQRPEHEHCACHHEHEECSCENHKHDEEKCGCRHDHEHHHHHDEKNCGCEHHHDHDDDSGCCCHHHDHEHGEECTCGHHHHEEEDHCCCGHHHEGHDHHCCHDHGKVENSIDTDWDVSHLDPKQYKLLFSVLGAIATVKNVDLQPYGLKITSTPEGVAAIREAFEQNHLQVSQIQDESKLKTEIHIDEMDCPTEEGLIRAKLKTIEGVSGLEFNLMNRVLTVRHNPGQIEIICGAIRSLGYTPEVVEAGKTQALSEFKPTQIPWWRFGVGFVFALGSEAAHFMSLPDWVSLLLAVIAVAIVGLGTFKKGLIAFRNLNFNMNALMAVAVVGAILIGSWSEGAMVMVLFELSEAIEQLSLDRARSAIRSLLSLTPEVATVKNDSGAWEKLPAKEVQPGMIIRVAPGDRIPVDGIIQAGVSAVNQAPITGESLPVEKKPGDQLFAGTINENGSLEYKATNTLDNSMPARIISAIENAQSSRAPTQRFVDVFAKYYTPTVFVIAIGTAIIPPLLNLGTWFDWIYKALTLLVIACPCALVISTPVTIVSGLAAAARKGLLIKGGTYLEKGRTLKFLALDKTGTITEGHPSVVDFKLLSSTTDKERSLVIASSLAERNNHPVSRAAGAFARSQTSQLQVTPEISFFEQLPGKGVVGTIEGREYYLGNMRGLDRYLLQNDKTRAISKEITDRGFSPLFLANSSEIIAVFAIADKIKESSKKAIRDLLDLGITPVMLTGDNAATARHVAEEVGIKKVKYGLLPEDKLKLIETMARKDPTGMVGDGINDTPALARSDIGFAMGAAGTDTAIETADVALMDDDLRKIPAFISLSKATFSILVQNIVFALAIKFVFFILTYMGLATMWMAVFADTGVCLMVVANGLRILSWKSPTDR